MSAPIRSTDDILAALREHPEWRRAVWRAFLADEQEAAEIRKELLTDALLKLPSRFEKAEEERKEEQKKVWETIRDLADAQRETNATLKFFVEAAGKRFGQLGGEVGTLKGEIFEVKTLPMLTRNLASKMGDVSFLDANAEGDLLEVATANGEITEEQSDQVSDADALAVGKDRKTGKLVCIAAEILKTVRAADVERAAKRAALLLRASRNALASRPQRFRSIFAEPPSSGVGVVIGASITDHARRMAEREGALFIRRGDKSR